MSVLGWIQRSEENELKQLILFYLEKKENEMKSSQFVDEKNQSLKNGIQMFAKRYFECSGRKIVVFEEKKKKNMKEKGVQSVSTKKQKILK